MRQFGTLKSGHRRSVPGTNRIVDKVAEVGVRPRPDAEVVARARLNSKRFGAAVPASNGALHSVDKVNVLADVASEVDLHAHNHRHVARLQTSKRLAFGRYFGNSACSAASLTRCAPRRDTVRMVVSGWDLRSLRTACVDGGPPWDHGFFPAENSSACLSGREVRSLAKIFQNAGSLQLMMMITILHP